MSRASAPGRPVRPILAERRAPGRPEIRPGTGAATRRTGLWIALAAFLIFGLTGGGRIVGSDEVTMLELSRSMLRGRIDVPEGATLPGRGGRQYTKNAPAQALLALPVVAAAEGLAAGAGLEGPRRVLAVRFVASFFNALVAAALLSAFYVTARQLGVGIGAALGAALLLGFTTPLWVYAKSFMAEPLQGLGLLLTLGGSLEAARRPGARWWAAAGFLLATWAKPSMAPMAGLCLLPMLGPERSGADFLFVLGLVAVAVMGFLGYNLARFGDAFETGYGAQATPSAYSTPLLIGLYGLLLSSGKGILWFAPALWQSVAGWRAMAATGGRARLGAFAILAAAGAALLLYSTFEHWAGDGSFGPRYLVPVLPLVFLAVAFALDRGSPGRRRAIALLGALGLLVQIGGVSIHFGAQMREAGDYPYTLALSDPRFMSESHFHPAFSPIAGHWRMLARNAREHLAGQAPRLTGAGEADPRVGASPEDQRRLLHALDFWWAYLVYAGFPALPVSLTALLIAALAAWSLARVRAVARAEALA